MENVNKRKKDKISGQLAKLLLLQERVDKSNPDRLKLDMKRTFYGKKK